MGIGAPTAQVAENLQASTLPVLEQLLGTVAPEGDGQIQALTAVSQLLHLIEVILGG
ncbi:hypothetical protein D3C85_1915370 [compost metagenome]